MKVHRKRRTYPGAVKTINVKIQVRRMTHTREPFIACARIGGVAGGTCRPGKNPRKAIAASMHAAAKRVAARSGAFSRYRRRRRR